MAYRLQVKNNVILIFDINKIKNETVRFIS